MENKYYTPTIEEFHVGFEYEYLESEKWKKETITEGSLSSGDCGANHYVENDFDHIRNLLPKGKIRSKLLKREDIESLGWKPDKINEFEKGEHVLNICPNTINIYVQGDYDGEMPHFNGTIKNKSELQKLMTQLNIK